MSSSTNQIGLCLYINAPAPTREKETRCRTNRNAKTASSGEAGEKERKRNLKIKAEDCRYCKYSSKTQSANSAITCDYIGITGHQRPCLPGKCRAAGVFQGGGNNGNESGYCKSRKALYGITMGMTNQELVQYSGYGIYTIRTIRKNPEKYKKALQEKAKKEDEQRRKREYVSTFKEEFAWSGQRLQTGLRKMPAGRNEVEECF